MLSPATIRQAVASAVAMQLGPSGWRESRLHFALFPGPPDGDGRPIQHLAYAVGLTRSVDPRTDMQRTALGTTCRTFGAVKFTHRLKADAQVADGDDALDAELALSAAIMTARASQLIIRREGVPTRRVIADGTYYLGEIGFSVLHTYALS
jgi:hypothetical protein